MGHGLYKNSGAPFLSKLYETGDYIRYVPKKTSSARSVSHLTVKGKRKSNGYWTDFERTVHGSLRFTYVRTKLNFT